MSNPLVAARVDSSTPLAGAFLLEDGEALVQAINDGDWLGGTLAGVSAVADGVALAVDPLGSFIAMGLGWVMEHLDPIKSWFNDLTGDADEVAAFSQTWVNVSQHLTGTAEAYEKQLNDLARMSGQAVDAYRHHAIEVIAHLRGAASWAKGMADAFQIASMIVKVVHDLLRDCLAQVLGMVIAMVIEAVATVGLAIPAIIAQVAAKISALAAKMSATMMGMFRQLSKLKTLLGGLTRLFRKSGPIFDSVPRLPAGAAYVAAPNPHSMLPRESIAFPDARPHAPAVADGAVPAHVKSDLEARLGGEKPKVEPGEPVPFKPKEEGFDPYSFFDEADIPTGNIDRLDYDQIPESLTARELDLHYDYSGSTATQMNRYLRGEAQGYFGVDEDIATLNSGLQKWPDTSGHVYRGTYLKPEQLEKYVPGDVVTEPGFTSTSMNPHVAFEGNTYYVINSKHGKNISAASMSPLEQEVLFPTETKFKVLARHDDVVNGRVAILLDEVD